MPNDSKRINGPDATVPYSIYTNLNSESSELLIKNQLQFRVDKRKHNEFRKMFIRIGVVSQAKGSAYVEMGQTRVICSVFDPREIPNKAQYSTQGELFCEFKFAPFASCKRKGHQQDAEEKEYSLIMQRALEPAVCRHEFPNFQVDIYALVLDNDGSALSTAIMAASLALANASVPMFGIVTAVTVVIYDDLFIIDPTYKEEALCLKTIKKLKPVNHGIIMQAMLSQHDQISEFFLTGSMDINFVNSSIDILSKTSNEIYPVLQEALRKSILKMIKKKNQQEK
ncbi:PREDICTED: exosome complex component MTR3-like [Ceratosolen solmsi marchali]|uniref:Exosome complex component MTR3-like n=1 Tax=Ceratosolen solmsi marchali TaxID=326594 RepID=A0AAJ7DWQ7_9HYME|nr:PREDICTED: exosome complex component MTR3-like [Ceratosolen solmsi marchali]